MATYFFCNGGVDNNWGTAGNWGIVTGTPGGGATVPLATDNAIFDANSPNCTVNTSSRVCLTLNFNGTGAGAYANTITMNQQITVSGSITLSATMGIAGAATLSTNATATLTSNGTTWPNAFTFAGVSTTVTLADNWTVNGTVTFNGTGTAMVLNGSGGVRTLICNGSLTASQSITGGGNLNITMAGAGTVSGAGVITMNGARTFDVNATGAIVFSGTVSIRLCIIKYTTAASVTTTGSTLSVSSTTSYNCAGITWNNVTFSGTSITHTLLADLNLGGVLTLPGTTATTINGAFNINCAGINVNGATNIVGGTATFVMNGTGTLQTSGGSGAELHNNLTINTAGTVTLGVTLNYDTGVFTYTAGTIAPGTSTFLTTATTTFNFNASGFTFNNLTCSSNCTFQGTDGFIVAGTFKSVTSTAARTLTFKNGNTYTFNGTVIFGGTNDFALTVKSQSAGNQATLTISAASNQIVSFVTATDIDSSLGATVYDYKGTLSNASNWYLLTSPLRDAIQTDRTGLYSS